MINTCKCGNSMSFYEKKCKECRLSMSPYECKYCGEKVFEPWQIVEGCWRCKKIDKQLIHQTK
jgi:hypothetical protein